MRNKLLAIVLSVCTIVSSIPCVAFATETLNATEGVTEIATESVTENTTENVTEIATANTSTATSLNTSDSSAEEIVAQMTLEQKIGQMIMPAFRKWDGSNVTSINDEIYESVGELGIGGVILFSENFDKTVSKSESIGKTTKLINDLQSAATDDDSLSGLPLLIATDQEGGSVCRVDTGTYLSGNMALAASGDLQDVRDSADIIGDELQALGINVDFAPVMDVNNNPDNPVIGVRSFSDDPATVAKLGATFVKQLQSNNLSCAVKHFPGHGDVAEDSHTGLPSLSKTYSQLRKCELVPFNSGISAGVDIIMTAHIQFPEIEKTTYKSIDDGSEITLPATLSKEIITNILREDMGYDGVVTTDALNMSAIAKHFDPQDSARLAINAGVDILLMPVTITDEEGIDELEEYINGIAAQVRAGDISEDRITESALRIVKLKEKRGILETATDNLEERIENALSVVGSEEHHATEMKIALKTITLVKNEGNTLPLDGDKDTIVFTPYSNEVVPYEYGAEQLKSAGIIDDTNQVEVVSYGAETTVEEYVDKLKDYDQIVVTSESSSAKAYTSNQSKFIDSLIAYVHKQGKKVTLVSCQLPYDSARYQKADSILLCYNPKGASTHTFGRSFAASLMIAYGYQYPSGKLPVNVPKLNSKYVTTSTLLYKRGYGMTDFRKPCVKLNIKKTLSLRKGKTKKLKVYGLINGDSVKSWKSSDKSVAGVSKSGLVKAKKRGTATISVTTVQGAKKKITIKVK